MTDLRDAWKQIENTSAGARPSGTGLNIAG
jgi:hypothetical protein